MRRVAGETYPNTLLTDGWPSDGLLLARSAVAERILVDRYGADRGAVGRDYPQWWPARAISIEEYLEYYATTLAKHRPKFDHVAVVFLRPWWSEHLADDGVARMFELEPAPAKATHVRPLAGSDPAPPATPAPAADVAAGRFRDALRIAGALSGYAASHLGASSEPRDGPRDAEGWERRRARLAEAYGNSSASPRDKKRDPPRDVSTAHVDVVNYPSVVLTLPWYEIVTKTPGDLVLADLPRSLVGADFDDGRPRGLGRSSISPLDGPPEKRPVAAEFGAMGRERSNSVRSIGSPRNSLGGGSPSPSASAAKKGFASPPKAPREPSTARERADVAALLGARSDPGDFDERAFRDAVRRDGEPAEAEALPPSVFRPASPTLEALPAADVTEEDSEARSSKASSASPPASPKDNPEVARAAESKDGGEEDSGGEAAMERDDDDAPPAADDDDDAAMDDADAAPAAAEEDDEEEAAAEAPAAMDADGDDDERSAKRPKTARAASPSSSDDAVSEEAEAAAEDDDEEAAAEAPAPATAAGGPRCDKCDGAHETADCPYFKKEREPSPVQNMKPVQPLSSAGLLKRRASDRSLSGQMPPASPRERPPAGKPGSPRSRSRKPPSPRAAKAPRLPSPRADEAPPSPRAAKAPKLPSPRAAPAKSPSPPPKPPSPPPPKPPSPRAEPPPPKIVQKPPRCEPAPKLASPRQRTPPPAAAGSALLCRKGCGRGFTHPPARVAHEKSCRGVPGSSRAAPPRGSAKASPRALGSDARDEPAPRGRPRSNTPAGEPARPPAAGDGGGKADRDARLAKRALDRGDSPPPPPPPVRPAALDQPAAPSQPKPPAHGPFSEGSDHLGDDAHNRLFDAAAFDRASRRDCPSLAPPEDAPVDGSRPLVYLGAGDDVEDCGDRCHKASSQTKRALLAKHDADRRRSGPAAGSSARHVAPELWLYLAARGADRSRAGLARASARPTDVLEDMAEREVAALLGDLETLALSSAAAQAAACAKRGRALGLVARKRKKRERDGISDDDDGGSSGDDDASPRSDEGADDRDLRRARRERVAVLEVLEKVDRCVQQLVNKDDAALRDACAAAATAHNDAELILTKVVAAQAAGVGGSPTRDRVAAAEARVASASRQLEHARSGRRDLASLRRSWFAAKGVIQGRVVGGVARPAARGLPARKKLRSRSDSKEDAATEEPEADREDADADLPAYEWAGARRPRTLAIYDRRCRLHETKVYCMEQSRRAVAAAAVVEAAALRHPTRLWVERSVHEGYLGRATALLSYAHSRVYVSAVRRRCLDLKTNATMLFGGEDEDTCGNRHTWDASLAASAAVLQAVDAVVSGEAKNALCAVRPPGHHAGASVNALGAESNGYCILNHAALGAKYAAHERGLQRVAVFDFDVHHGNGTEDVLARTCDPRFMYLSLHACGRDVYPGSGKREVPDHPGVLNLPHAYEEPMTAEWCHAYAMPKVLKALDGFRPDLLILSSGFDAHKRDPVDLGRFDASDYGDLTRACVDWARRNCCGRVVSVLEGGYGVDCGPAGEYVQSGRREAFDTCLRAHVDELIADDAADTADDPEPANPQTAHVSAPHLEAAAADRRGKAAAFFQEPPPDQSRLGAAAGPAGPQALTAAALARLGDVKPGVKLPDVSDGSGSV